MYIAVQPQVIYNVIRMGGMPGSIRHETHPIIWIVVSFDCCSHCNELTQNCNRSQKWKYIFRAVLSQTHTHNVLYVIKPARKHIMQ